MFGLGMGGPNDERDLLKSFLKPGLISRMIFNWISRYYGLEGADGMCRVPVCYIRGNNMPVCNEACDFKKELSSINAITDVNEMRFASGGSKTFYSTLQTKAFDVFDSIFERNSHPTCNLICDECASKAGLLCQLSKEQKDASKAGLGSDELPNQFVVADAAGISYLLKGMDLSNLGLDKLQLFKLGPGDKGSKYSRASEEPASFFSVPSLVGFSRFQGADLLGMDPVESDKLEKDNPKQ